jgi:hypothetical protein
MGGGRDAYVTLDGVMDALEMTSRRRSPESCPERCLRVTMSQEYRRRP